MIRPDQTNPMNTRPYIQWATAQIRQMLEETPAVCLFLLEQTDNAPQSCLADDLSQFLDRVTLDHQGSAIDALSELLPWVDCQLVNEHLLSLGACTLSRHAYLNSLQDVIKHPPIDWKKYQDSVFSSKTIAQNAWLIE